jgi:hypothetical protein
MGGENIYKMFSCHHPTVRKLYLTHGGSGQDGGGGGADGEQGNRSQQHQM